MDPRSFTVLAQIENYLHPLLTDEEIIETFGPLEREFFEWQKNGIFEGRSLTSFLDALHQRWPDQANLEEKFLTFSSNWNGRHLRRTDDDMNEEELVELLSSTNCFDPDQLAKALSTLQTPTTPYLNFGVWDIGGKLASYYVDSGNGFLDPDVPLGKMTDPESPRLLHHVIMAIDQSFDPGLCRETDMVVKSASSDDPSLKETFCFLQLGRLMVCTGVDMEEICRKPDAESDATGYNVVVRLGPDGYPTGPLYAIYNNDRELPPMRLQPFCSEEFFMAKLDDSLRDIYREDFKFDVVSSKRCALLRAKKDASKIIPNDILG